MESPLRKLELVKDCFIKLSWGRPKNALEETNIKHLYKFY